MSLAWLKTSCSFVREVVMASSTRSTFPAEDCLMMAVFTSKMISST